MLLLELRIAKASFGGLPMRTQPQQTAHPCAFAAVPGIRARDLLGIQRCLSTSKLRHNASLRTPGSPLTGFSGRYLYFLFLYACEGYDKRSRHKTVARGLRDSRDLGFLKHPQPSSNLGAWMPPKAEKAHGCAFFGGCVRMGSYRAGCFRNP